MPENANVVLPEPDLGPPKEPERPIIMMTPSQLLLNVRYRRRNNLNRNPSPFTALLINF